MLLHRYPLAALLVTLPLAGCNLISGIDSRFTFDAGGTGGAGGAVGAGGDAVDGGGDAADPTDAADAADAADDAEPTCDGGPCPTPMGLALTGDTFYTAVIQASTKSTATFEDACPKGQVIIGLQGVLQPFTTSVVHGQIQAQCGVLTLSGTGPFAVTTPVGALTPVEGTAGTIAWQMQCPDNQVVVGFSGRAGALVDYLSIDCTPLSVKGGPGSYSIGIGAVTPKAGQGGPGGNDFADTRCGGRKVANQIKGTLTTSLISLSLGCHTVSLTY